MRRLPLLLLLVVASVRAGEDKGPAGAGNPKAILEPADADGFVRVRDSRRHFTIVVPAQWEVEQSSLSEGFSRFAVRVPGADRPARLFLELPRKPMGPRGYPESNRQLFSENPKMSRIRIGSETIPHLIYSKQEGDNVLTVCHAYCLHGGRTIIVTLVVQPAEFEKLYRPFLQAALTAGLDMPPWPSIPEGYVVKTKRGIRYAAHPEVKKSARETIALLEAARKRFEKFHGKLPETPEGTPDPVVYLHSDNQQAAALAGWLGQRPAQFEREWSTLCCFAVPAAKSDAEGTRTLIREYLGFLLYRRYGSAVPAWVRGGEASIAAIETETGKALPRIDSGSYGWSEGLTLQKLDLLHPGTWTADTCTRQFVFYVAFFHCGGKEYRNAYRAFLDEIGTHYDPRAAAERHLEPLDYEKVRVAATRFMHTGFKVQ